METRAEPQCAGPPAIVGAVRPRARVLSLVALAAAAAGAAAIGAALLSGGNGDGAERPEPREGSPPLVLDLGVRTDAEASALRRAARLYDDDRPREARRIFARYDSVEAQVGTAFATWPEDSLDRLERLARAEPKSAFVRLHLGLARFWAGRTGDAVTAWRAALRVQPDSSSALRAEDLLNPNMARGRPHFVPSFPLPRGVRGLRPDRQLAELERAAERPDARAKLFYGVALQRLGRPVSALAQFDAAAALEPGDAEAQVAAAVGRFEKARPAAAFSRLGPLTRRFPRAPSVRFHLGLLLLWIGRVEEAKPQLERVGRLEPRSPLAREANRLLERLEDVEADDK